MTLSAWRMDCGELVALAVACFYTRNDRSYRYVLLNDGAEKLLDSVETRALYIKCMHSVGSFIEQVFTECLLKATHWKYK